MQNYEHQNGEQVSTYIYRNGEVHLGKR